MPSTTQYIDQTFTTAAREGVSFTMRLWSVIAASMARRQTRRIVQGLSEAQLRDSGIDRTAVLGSKRVIHVDPRLTTYLASLR